MRAHRRADDGRAVGAARRRRYVQVAVPAAVQQVVELRLLEQMTTRAGRCRTAAHSPDGVAELAEMAERAGAVVLGPGLGRTDGAVEFARRVAAEIAAPLLVDADGLNAHAGRLELLRVRAGPTVLTPHAGELARLLGLEPDEDGERTGSTAPARPPS